MTFVPVWYTTETRIAKTGATLRVDAIRALSPIDLDPPVTPVHRFLSFLPQHDLSDTYISHIIVHN